MDGRRTICLVRHDFGDYFCHWCGRRHLAFGFFEQSVEREFGDSDSRRNAVGEQSLTLFIGLAARAVATLDVAFFARGFVGWRCWLFDVGTVLVRAPAFDFGCVYIAHHMDTADSEFGRVV